MDYMYNACSTTARRGALDWAPVFEKANLPIFEKLYESVRNGTETSKALEFNGRSTYRQDLARELKEIDDQEIWRAGKNVSACSQRARPLFLHSRENGSLIAPRLQGRVDDISEGLVLGLGCWSEKHYGPGSVGRSRVQ